MKSRNREFNDVRNKNLAKSNSSMLAYSNMNTNFRQQNASNNQSFTSFTKKSKPDVCITCVNKNIVNEKKAKEKNNKIKEIEQCKAQIQFRNSQRDVAKEYRQKMMKQADKHNKSMISLHQNSTYSERQLDNKFISEAIQIDKKIMQQERQRIERQKQLTLKYRKELYLQYKSEEQRKNQQKIDKLKPQVNQLNLKYVDRSKMIKDYSTQIKKQINDNNYKKIIEKEKQIEQERQALEASRKQFLKYTEFSKDDKSTHSINPEVFQQLKVLDYSRKIKKIQEREMKNKLRQEQLRRERQLYKSETERSFKMKRDYEKDLKQQMTQKILKKALERDEDLKFPWRIQKYTEDIAKQSRISKPCQQCKHQYDEKCMI